MVNHAKLTVSGYAATEPTFKKLDNGISVTKLRIAFTDRKRDRNTGEWVDGPTTFMSVQCWRALADNVARCIRKGDPVLVEGRLQVREYETSAGEKRKDIEVDATSFGHDLNRGVANFSRTRPSASETPLTRMPGEVRPEELAAMAAAEAAGDLEPGSGFGDVVDPAAAASLARELSGSADAGDLVPVPA